MGINLNSRIIADTRLAGISGMPIAGGYLLKLTVEFAVMNWDLADRPVVIFAPARVYMKGNEGLQLGLAVPETVQPFTVSNYASTRAASFDLFLSQTAMDVVEKRRDGQGVPLGIKLHGEIRLTGDVHPIYDDIHGDVNLVQWLGALEQAGYGRSVLFEVPIPSQPEAAGAAVELLEAARQHFARGHYPDAVAKCRMVIEGLTSALGQDDLLRAAVATQKKDRTREQRELAMRQVAMDFASLAHHPTGVPQDELFDRNAAQMMLSMTAALVSSGLRAR